MKSQKVSVLSFEEVKALQEKDRKGSTKQTNPIVLKQSVLQNVENGRVSNTISMRPSDLHLDIPDVLANRMFPHQKDAMQWLSGIHSSVPGAVLGDDMGMGKTFTVITFLCGLLRSRHIKNVLILCPVSVVESWSREMNNHLIPNTKVSHFHHE